MNRRTACQTAGGLLVGVAGCLSVDDPTEEESADTDTDEPAPDDTPPTDTTPIEPETKMIDSDRVDGASFTRTGDCEKTGTATIEFSDTGPEATISGCLTAHNGCSEPVIDSVTNEGDSFRIVIGEADLSGPDTFCTEALVQRGYELHVRFRTELPKTIEITHNDAESREVVATKDRP